MRATSNYFFNNFDQPQEQDLLHELIIEAVSIYGQDMYYMPRTLTNYDKLYGTDDSSAYNNAIMLCMFIDSVDGFAGDGNFMSKFGLEIRDEATFIFPQRTFAEEVITVTEQLRPNEGDLIYFPLNRKCFKIAFVDKFQMFYPLGTLPTWKVKVELFEYSNETFATGIVEIDSIQMNNTTNVLDYSLTDEDGVYLTDEDGNFLINESYDLETIIPASDNEVLQVGTTNFPIGSDDFLDFSSIDPIAGESY